MAVDLWDPDIYRQRMQLDDQLLDNIKANLDQLVETSVKVSGHWGEEDGVYRLYHRSFKVFGLQGFTMEMVELLWDIRPDDYGFDEMFVRIINEGTTGRFRIDEVEWPGPSEHMDPKTGVWKMVPDCGSYSTNQRWMKETRPIVEAFWHAKYFVDMAIIYGRKYDEAPNLMDSGWAALLELYSIR